MNNCFDSKTVSATGAADGFGCCIAQTFCRLGARVFATDVAGVELGETPANTTIRTRVVDLCGRAAGAAWIRSIENETGEPLHVLVNNTAIWRAKIPSGWKRCRMRSVRHQPQRGVRPLPRG